MVGEGTGMPRDIDRFDRDYHHLVLWDANDRAIVGAYRIGNAAQIIAQRGIEGLYTHTLFKFSSMMDKYFANGLELGRSFVQPKYQTRHSLDYLWFGIGAYVRRFPQFRYLFGPASISRQYGNAAISRIAHHYCTHYNQIPVGVQARVPFNVDPTVIKLLSNEQAGVGVEQDFKALRDSLAEQGLPVPTLYKHYSQVTEKDGVTFCAFNIDSSFGDCVDGFVIADLDKLKPRKRERYLGQEKSDIEIMNNHDPS